MLAPADRHTLLELLRPPPGAVLDQAVGTTFSLNLDALLLAPAAFALFDVGEEEAAELEPLGLLDALRRHADRITLFCQAGQIAPPPAHRRLLAYLEATVVPVAAPRGGVFHPKVWVLRYRHDDGVVSHRALVLSRNLTYDRSWDSALRLDSVPLTEEGGQALPGLARFVRALPELAVAELTAERTQDVRGLADEIEGVRWELPDGFDAAEFVSIGLGDSATDPPLPSTLERLLVLSPFIGAGLLRRLAAPQRTLVALPSWLHHVGADALDGWDTFVLDDAADLDAGDDAEGDNLADPRTELSGLHAKFYLAEHDGRSTLVTGSANATAAGWDSNVEAVVRLSGPTTTVGAIERILDPGADPIALGRLLLSYIVGDAAGDDLEDPMAGEELDRLRREIAAWRWVAQIVRSADESAWLMQLHSPAASPLPDDVAMRVWPISLPPAAREPERDAAGSWQASFPVSTQGITAFFALELRQGEFETRGVFKADLQGVPSDRHQRLLAALIGDADRLLRYLLLLLADASGAGDAAAAAAKWAAFGADDQLIVDELPLLEAMLRAVSSSPDKLAHVERLLADLRSVADGHFVPPELERVWRAVWASIDDKARR